MAVNKTIGSGRLQFELPSAKKAAGSVALVCAVAFVSFKAHALLQLVHLTPFPYRVTLLRLTSACSLPCSWALTKKKRLKARKKEPEVTGKEQEKVIRTIDGHPIPAGFHKAFTGGNFSVFIPSADERPPILFANPALTWSSEDKDPSGAYRRYQNYFCATLDCGQVVTFEVPDSPTAALKSYDFDHLGITANYHTLEDRLGCDFLRSQLGFPIIPSKMVKVEDYVALLDGHRGVLLREERAPYIGLDPKTHPEAQWQIDFNRCHLSLAGENGNDALSLHYGKLPNGSDGLQLLTERFQQLFSAERIEVIFRSIGQDISYQTTVMVMALFANHDLEIMVIPEIKRCAEYTVRKHQGENDFSMETANSYRIVNTRKDHVYGYVDVITRINHRTGSRTTSISDVRSSIADFHPSKEKSLSRYFDRLARSETVVCKKEQIDEAARRRFTNRHLGITPMRIWQDRGRSEFLLTQHGIAIGRCLVDLGPEKLIFHPVSRANS